jgi:hypothetical protein
MLNVVMLNVIMLNVIMLNVIMLNVIMLNVVMLNVIMLNVIMLNAVTLSVFMSQFNGTFLQRLSVYCHSSKWHSTECHGTQQNRESYKLFFCENKILDSSL